MKIIKVNQQPLESLQANVMVSNITFAQGDNVIESSQLSSKYPDFKFPGDFLSDRIYVVTEEKSPDQVLQELQSRNNKVELNQTTSLDPASEIKNKIAKIEKEISDFQQKKDKQSELEGLVSQKQLLLENINQLLASSQILIDSRGRILEKMSVYKSKLDQIGTKTSEEIKNDRKSRILKFMKGVRRKAHLMDEEKIEGVYPPLKFLLFLSVLSFVINFLLYITSFQWRILVVMLISLALLLLNAFIVNIFRPFYSKDAKAIEEILTAQHNSGQYKFTDDDHILITNAWVNAYDIELKRIDEVLAQNLQGKDHKQLETDSINLKQELESLTVNKNNDSLEEMSTEEYYKKRRELDILKIELENSGSSSAVSSGSQSPDLNKVRAELPFIIFNSIKSPQIAALQNDFITVIT